MGYNNDERKVIGLQPSSFSNNIKSSNTESSNSVKEITNNANDKLKEISNDLYNI